jgi:hypothetical protein
MTAEQFQAAIKARPFRPFSVHVADQHVIAVRHPELAWQTEGGRTIFVNTGGEKVEIVDLLLVTRLTYGTDNGSPRPPRGKRRKKS